MALKHHPDPSPIPCALPETPDFSSLAAPSAQHKEDTMRSHLLFTREHLLHRLNGSHGRSFCLNSCQMEGSALCFGRRSVVRGFDCWLDPFPQPRSPLAAHACLRRLVGIEGVARLDLSPRQGSFSQTRPPVPIRLESERCSLCRHLRS